jgi:hypothetical protein
MKRARTSVVEVGGAAIRMGWGGRKAGLLVGDTVTAMGSP